MASPLDLIRDIQELDHRIDELEAEVGRLPKHVAEIESKLESHKAELAAQKSALEENEKERRRLESETALNEAKDKKLHQQITEVKTNDQYRALRNEIAFVRKEVKKAEDATIDLMEAAESLAEKVAVADKALAEESEQVAKEVAGAEALVEGDRTKLAALRADRKKITDTMPPKLVKAYDRVRRKLGERAVSPMINGRCGSCNMVIRPQVQQDLRNRAEEVITCEFCGCILFVPETVPAEDPAAETSVG